MHLHVRDRRQPTPQLLGHRDVAGVQRLPGGDPFLEGGSCGERGSDVLEPEVQRRALEGDVFYQQSDTDGFDGDDAAYGMSVRFPSSQGVRGILQYRQYGEQFNPALGFIDSVGISTIVFGMSWPITARRVSNGRRRRIGPITKPRKRSMPVHSTPDMMCTQVRNQRLGPTIAAIITTSAAAAAMK